MANMPSIRERPTLSTQPAPSSVHITLHRLETVVDLIERRLARVENSQRSPRRRVVKHGVAQ
jgi:hypothetical protein